MALIHLKPFQDAQFNSRQTKAAGASRRETKTFICIGARSCRVGLRAGELESPNLSNATQPLIKRTRGTLQTANPLKSVKIFVRALGMAN